MKKTLAMILSMVLILSALSGCGAGGTDKSAADMTPEEVVAAAYQNLEDVKSMSYDMDMDMSFAVSMGTEELQTLDIATKAEADCIMDPMTMKMTMTMDMGEGTGEALDALVYLVQEGDTYIMYQGMENEDGTLEWHRQEMTDMKELMQYNAEDSMKLYMSSGEGFTENGTEEINGVEATRYDGVIKGEAMQEVMDASGMSEQLAALNMGGEENLFADAGDLAISIWIDKENLLPVKYEMDMTQLMQSIMEKALAAQLEGVEEAENIKMSVEKVFVAMDVKNYNGVDAIEVPEEALDAPLMEEGVAADLSE